MAYERKDLQIIGGSLNLSPPGDKIPIQDYLLAQNWRVDRNGKLASRAGYVQKFLMSGKGIAHSAAVWGGVEGAYYVATNGGSDGNALYWAFNLQAIATGFDGGRVAMIPMNGWMWVMNPGVQGKHNGSLGPLGFYAWGINPPGGQLPPHVRRSPARFPTSGTPSNGAPAAGAGGAGNGSTTAGPVGTYQFYVTFSTADQSYETNPGAASIAVTLAAGQDPILTGIPTSPDSQVGARNIYATGGTLANAYLVATINDNVSTALAFNQADWNALYTGGYTSVQLAPEWNDLSATDAGIVMPTTHDFPPAANGMVGPYFNRLFCFLNNRLYWTDPGLPQYWPGSTNPSTGNWVDVGIDNEEIVWCTMHVNTLVIYKERSIWWLVGDPDTGTLECVVDGIGLASRFGVVAAGQVDYFVAPNGLFQFTSSPQALDATDAIRPIFDSQQINQGGLTPIGGILPGSAWRANSANCYAVSLGYAMGKLYVSYAESSTAPSNVMLVFHEAKKWWTYHRTALSAAASFQGFVFDGVEMVAMTGDTGGNAVGYNVDDFRSFLTADGGTTSLECVYQSHYETAGLPDTQKVWLEVVVDIELGISSPTAASIYVGLDGGTEPINRIGFATLAGRNQVGFALAKNASGTTIVLRNPTDSTQKDCLAKSISVAVYSFSSYPVTIHGVHLYYYEEARLTTSVATLPSDLGTAKVKQAKELELDIDASNAAASVGLYSDLPGNQLALRENFTAANGGRALVKFPFAQQEGYLWRLVLAGAGFRIYGARLLARPIGVYVEAYEAAAGFVWDSQEMTFDSGITHIPRGYAIALAALPIKRARELSLEIDTFNGNVTVSFLSDLPGDAQAIRFQATINTGSAGRSFVKLPLTYAPTAASPQVEGRLFRLQLSGQAKFILYGASVEVLAVGVYIEAYEAAKGAVYDSRELDFGSPAFKEARELELDIETTGAVTAIISSDATGEINAQSPVVSTTGRQKVMVPLTINPATSQFIEGRFFRLIIFGTNAVRLYGARVLARPFGFYLSAAEAQGGGLWDSTELDLGSQTVKQLREIELEISAAGSYVVTLYTDLPGNVMTARATKTLGATSGRTTVQIPLQQGSVPDNYFFGRLARVTITSSSAFKLFGARIHARTIGVYVESYEAAGGAVWDSTPFDLGSAGDVIFDQLRFEIDTDGATSVAMYTDLPGEAFASRGSYPVTSSATGRHWATVQLPAGAYGAADSIEGRSLRLILSGALGFRLYRAQARVSRVGRYLAGPTANGAQDGLQTLEFDFASERVKLVKKIEIDMRADAAVAFNFFTSQGGTLASVYNASVSTTGRQTHTLVMPPGIRGRLVRVALSGGPARVFSIRIWARPVNEPGAKWEWTDSPVEPSEIFPEWKDLPVEPTPPAFTWTDLPVPPTPPEWQWAQLPVAPTEAQWFWAKVLAVEETPEVWSWVDLPITGPPA